MKTFKRFISILLVVLLVLTPVTIIAADEDKEVVNDAAGEVERFGPFFPRAGGVGRVGRVSGITTMAEDDVKEFTTFDETNNQQYGIMFDISISTAADISITSFDMTAQYGTQVVEFYFKDGSYVGSENDMGAWTFVGATTVNFVRYDPIGRKGLANVPISGLDFEAGQDYAIYITLVNGPSIYYKNGGESDSVSNEYMTIKPGVGRSITTGKIFDPTNPDPDLRYKLFSGTIYFTTTPSEYTVTFKDDDTPATVLKTETVKYGEDATPPNHPDSRRLEGYEPNGWAPDYTYITGDLEVIAQYKKMVYTVEYYDWGYDEDEEEYGYIPYLVYDSELDEDVPLIQEIEHGDAATPPASATLHPPTGHTFAGWDIDGDGIADDWMDDSDPQDIQYGIWYEYIVTSNLIAKPVFLPNPYTVTFYDWDDVEEDFVAITPSQTVTYGSSALPPDPGDLNIPEGKELVGWDIDDDGEADDWIDSTDPEDILKGIWYEYVVTGNVNAYPVFKFKDYTVTFYDWDDDEEEFVAIVPSQTVAHGSSATPPNPTTLNPAPEGYHIAGWDIDGDGVADDWIDDSEPENILKGIWYGYVVTGNVTAEVVYEKNEYTVRFFAWDDDEEDYVVISTQKVKHGEAADDSSLDPDTREGYEFIGWDEDFDEVLGNLDVYAEYEESGPPKLCISGPDTVDAEDDADVTYLVFAERIRANVGINTAYIVLRFDPSFFSFKSVTPLDGWELIPFGDDWELNTTPGDDFEGYYERTYTLFNATAKRSGVSGNFRILELVLECKDENGETKVYLEDSELWNGAHAYDELVVCKFAKTLIDRYSTFDVNRDGSVDLADVAAAAFFFEIRKVDDEIAWATLVEFSADPLGNSGKVVYSSPERCDVNKDGVVDIEDLILIWEYYNV